VTRSSGWWNSWWSLGVSSPADGGDVGHENGGAGGGGERYSLGIRQSSGGVSVGVLWRSSLTQRS
jgi:hypothetical protein